MSYIDLALPRLGDGDDLAARFGEVDAWDGAGRRERRLLELVLEPAVDNPRPRMELPFTGEDSDNERLRPLISFACCRKADSGALPWRSLALVARNRGGAEPSESLPDIALRSREDDKDLRLGPAAVLVLLVRPLGSSSS